MSGLPKVAEKVPLCFRFAFRAWARIGCATDSEDAESSVKVQFRFGGLPSHSNLFRVGRPAGLADLPEGAEDSCCGAHPYVDVLGGEAVPQRGEGVSGSASVFHVATGLNLTGATGQILDAGGDPEPSFWYLKGGWRGNIFDFGTTAISADYRSGKDHEVIGANSDSVGFQVVQRIAKTSTQLYIGGRMVIVRNTGLG